MKKYTLVFVLAMVAGMLSAFAPLPKVDQASVQVATLTAEETDGLLFMIEEEKMARDLYSAFYGLYGSSSFQKIASSEQVHMDELKVLLNSYSINDPTIGKLPEFSPILTCRLFMTSSWRRAVFHWPKPSRLVPQ